MAERLEVIITAKDQTGGVIPQIEGQLSSLGAVMSGLVVAGAAAAAAGVIALASGLNYAMNEAREANLVMAQTNAVLRSTQGVAGVTSLMVSDLANELAASTRFTDDQVQAAENLLLTFKSINSDVFPDTIGLATDLATAFGMELNGAVIMIGKALEDPIQGVTALRRVGVQLSEQQEQMIKNFVEQGNKASAMSLILEELNSQVGGSAEAAAEAAGPWENFSKRISEIAETIGGPLLTAFDNAVLLLEPVITFVEGLAETFRLNAEAGGPIFAFQQLMMSLIPPELQADFAQLMFAVQEVALAFKETWPEIQPIVQDIVIALRDSLIPVIRGGFRLAAELLRAFADWWRSDGVEVATAIKGLITGFLDLNATLSRIFGVLAKANSEFVTLGKNIIDGIVKGIMMSPDAIGKALKDILDKAIANIKRALGIASPSKVMMGIGVNLMQGIEGGITSGAGLPQRAMSRARTGLISATTQTGSSITNSRATQFYGPVTFAIQGERPSLDNLSDQIFLQTITAGA